MPSPIAGLSSHGAAFPLRHLSASPAFFRLYQALVPRLCPGAPAAATRSAPVLPARPSGGSDGRSDLRRAGDDARVSLPAGATAADVDRLIRMLELVRDGMG